MTWFHKHYSPFWQALRSNPDAAFAVKSTTVMAMLIFPCILLGYSFIGSTLALGAFASALTETDDHPKGRIKALLLTNLGFLITATSVALVRPFPILFGIGLVASTILFVLIGGIGERYRGISFGAILMGVYAMLVHPSSSPWYHTPLFLLTGALVYEIISLTLLYLAPFRPLEEKLAKGFEALAQYLEKKSMLFSQDTQTYSWLTSQIAMANVAVVTQLERCKEVINSYSDEVSDPMVLRTYLQRFMLLQSLHERVASAGNEEHHPRLREEYSEILSGFGELMHQLAKACRLLAEHMLSGKPYEHPVSIGWLISALEFELEKTPEKYKSSLVLTLHNLSRSHLSLLQLYNPDKSTSLPRLRKNEETLWQSFKNQFNYQNARFRYAIRLSSCFLAGYLILLFLKLDHAEWIILTSLIVNQPTYSETRRKLLQRMLGTLLGIVLGIATMHLLPTLPGQMLMIIFCAAGFFYYKQSNYALSVVFVTVYVLFSNYINTDSTIGLLWPRIIDTLIGSLLAIMAIRLLWPDWQYKKLPGLLQAAMEKNANYFSKVIRALTQVSEYDELSYRIARREAHVADNQLSLSWQSMRLEPKQHQSLMEHAFTMTYLNHALISYISALGALRDTHPETFSGFRETAQQIKEIMQKISSQINNVHAEPNATLKPLLHQLRERIENCHNTIEKQQLRLLYNIAGVSQKLNEQSQYIQTPKNK